MQKYGNNSLFIHANMLFNTKKVLHLRAIYIQTIFLLYHGKCDKD